MVRTRGLLKSACPEKNVWVFCAIKQSRSNKYRGTDIKRQRPYRKWCSEIIDFHWKMNVTTGAWKKLASEVVIAETSVHLGPLEKGGSKFSRRRCTECRVLQTHIDWKDCLLTGNYRILAQKHNGYFLVSRAKQGLHPFSHFCGQWTSAADRIRTRKKAGSGWLIFNIKYSSLWSKLPHI